ncbi:MAG: EamA family transporter [Patescibacteria group bacterium]
MSWFTFSILSLICYGVQNFLFKMSAERKYNTAWITFSFMGTVAITSSIFFLFFEKQIFNYKVLLLLGLLNSAAFLASTIFKIEGLKYIDTSILYPITRLKAAPVIFFSLILFKDQLSLNQFIGLIVSIIIMVLLTSNNNKEKVEKNKYKKGILLALLALFFGVIGSFTSKFGAISTGIFSFMAVSYFFNSAFSLLLIKKLEKKDENLNTKGAVTTGLIIGVINFLAFYLFLKALAIGPLSIISSMVGLSFLITIILSVFIYKEKITSRRIMGIILAAAAVILMRG